MSGGLFFPPKGDHIVFVFLCLNYFICQNASRSIHVVRNSGISSFFFNGGMILHGVCVCVCVCITTSLSIQLLMFPCLFVVNNAAMDLVV